MRTWCISLAVLFLAGQVLQGQTTRPSPETAKLDRSKMEDIDGQKQTGDGVRRRPWVKEDHKGTLEVSDYWIHDITDHKALFITSTSTDKPKVDDQMPTYGRVVIRNCEIGPVNLEQRGLHIDAIKADGSMEPAVRPTLLIEDVLIHDTDGGVMTILLKGGAWSEITLRRVELQNVHHPVMIWGSTEYPIGQVTIEDCPGLRVAIQGDPGSVGPVTVRNCPGASISNARNDKGVVPGASIIYESPKPLAPTSQPAQDAARAN